MGMGPPQAKECLRVLLYLILDTQMKASFGL